MATVTGLLVNDITNFTKFFGEISFVDADGEPINYESKGKLVHRIEILNEDSVKVFVYPENMSSDIPLDNFDVKLEELPNNTLEELYSWCENYQPMVFHNDLTDRFFMSEVDGQDDTFMVVTEKSPEIYDTGIFDLYVLCPKKQTKIVDKEMLLTCIKDQYKIGIKVIEPYKS